jgi:hypothetical protein
MGVSRTALQQRLCSIGHQRRRHHELRRGSLQCLRAPDPVVGAHAFADAVAAVAPDAVMLADAGAPAVLADAPVTVMLADAGAAAVLAGENEGG